MRNTVPRHTSESAALCHNWRIENTPVVAPPSTEPDVATFEIDHDMDGGPQPAADEARRTDDWQWVMVTNPLQSRDRDTMRNVRAHVMNNYLSREQKNPNSTDVRVRNPNARKSRPKAISTHRSLEGSTESTPQPQKSLTPRPHLAGVGQKRQEAALEPDRLPICGLGSRYDAFKFLPKFDNKDIDVEMLKAHCTTYFGSRAMSKRWIPILLLRRTTFLSTLCISSAHMDLMQMGVWNPKNPRTLSSVESVRTLAVRDETVRLISQNLSDPKIGPDDGNIVAVLQLFCGDMIVSDDQTMLLHEQGMWSMVAQRGGLDRLGGDGVIANMLVVKVFELCIFRECRPRSEYIDYACRISTSTRPDIRSSFPESPLYCPSGVYRFLGRSKMCSTDILDVINTVRDLTQVVLDLQKWLTLLGPAQAGLDDFDALENRKRSLVMRILDYTPNPQDAVFEATRLCAFLYANAVIRNTSFSKTARNIGVADSEGGLPATIRRQLMRTDLSACWDEMVGVLFWILLVSSAACNERLRAPGAGRVTGKAAETQAIRQWFVAMIVRCSILLGFKHTVGTLRSVQTLLAVQDVLRGGDDGSVIPHQAFEGFPNMHKDLSIRI